MRQTEHTSQRMCRVMSDSSTKTPPAQGVCSSRTAEMLSSDCDVRCTSHASDVSCVASRLSSAETLSNVTPPSLTVPVSEM